MHIRLFLRARKQMSKLHLLCDFRYFSQEQIDAILREVHKLERNDSLKETLNLRDSTNEIPLGHFLHSLRDATNVVKYYSLSYTTSIVVLLSDINQKNFDAISRYRLDPMLGFKSSIVGFATFLGKPIDVQLKSNGDYRLDLDIYNIIIRTMEITTSMEPELDYAGYANLVPKEHREFKQLERDCRPYHKLALKAKIHFTSTTEEYYKDHKDPIHKYETDNKDLNNKDNQTNNNQTINKQ